MKTYTPHLCKAFLLILIFTAALLPAQAQVLVQDFNDLPRLNAFQGTPPDAGQVDRINLNRAGDGTAIFSLGSAGADKFLEINKVRNEIRHFDRTTGINNEPFLRISFDFSVVNANMTGKLAAFFIGNNLNNNSFFPNREERWAQVGIYVNPNGSFYLTHEILFPNGNVFEVARTVAFTGRQRISIITSNSNDGPMVYTGPDGTPDVIGNGFVHIWVGDDYKLVGPALKGAESSINAVKFLLWSNNLVATARMDNLGIAMDIEMDPLPVEFLSFSGRTEGSHVLLDWETASELNSSHFEVERSMDGVEFTAIGTVKAAGDSKSRLLYIFTDRNAAQNYGGTIYYRLHQIDTDGSSQYSQVVQVVLPGSSSVTQKVFPNPFENELRLRFLTDKAQHVRFRVLSVQGDVVMEEQQIFNPSGQEQVYRLPGTARLKAGIYMLEISNGNEIRMQRIVKL